MAIRSVAGAANGVDESRFSLLAANPGVYDADFFSLATVTTTDATTTGIEFYNIPSAYQHLQLRVVARGTFSSTLAELVIRFNSDAGANYTRHSLQGNGTGPAPGGASGATSLIGSDVASGSSTASVYGASVITILDYASTGKNKTVFSNSAADQNGSGVVSMRSGMWVSTNSITSIQCFISSTDTPFAQHSTFALYGIKAP